MYLYHFIKDLELIKQINDQIITMEKKYLESNIGVNDEILKTNSKNLEMIKHLKAKVIHLETGKKKRDV